MKRSVCSVLILLLLLCPVAADAQEFGENGFESLPLSPEFEEISALEFEILTQANQIAAVEFGQGDSFFSREHIGWDPAYKLYYECDPYELGTDCAPAERVRGKNSPHTAKRRIAVCIPAFIPVCAAASPQRFPRVPGGR